MLNFFRFYSIVFLFFFSFFVTKQAPLLAQVLTKDQVMLQVLFTSLHSFHVHPREIDDAYSKDVYELYIKWLDPQKRFFMASDMARLSIYEEDIDDELQSGELTFYQQAIQVWRLRLDQLQPKVEAMIDGPFDFFKAETLHIKRKELAVYPQTESELLTVWRKQLKHRLLNMYLDDVEAALKHEKTVSENKKPILATLEEPIVIDPELLLAAQKKLKEDVAQLFKNLRQETDENLKYLYVNALLNVYDSHTSYFPPEKKEDFDISISGQLEGIGAVLSEKDGFIVIERILAGGAASRQGVLKAKDKILKVGQGQEGVYESIIGTRVREAVKLIRGKKGSFVRLWVEQVSGKSHEVLIQRDLVLIEETFAKAAVISDQDRGLRTGYVTLPKFYRNFKDKNGRNSSDDVRQLLIQLQEQDVNGIVLDLRNNEGGALLDAVQLAGLFIDEGPIVQVSDRSKAPNIYRDEDVDIVYDGPLIVLINQYSASAAEIVAAALQDYGRALVLGSDSYGKGSVQTFLDLKRLYPRPAQLNPELGSLKLTIQKFYRVSGGSTQLKGVQPDLPLPDRSRYVDVGERHLDFPLIWDRIESSAFVPWQQDLYLSDLAKKSKLRVAKDTRFVFLNRYFDYMKTIKDKSLVQLHIDDQIKHRKFLTAIDKEYDAIMLPFKALTFDVIGKPKDWVDALETDVYLHEALRVLYDSYEVTE